MQRSTFGGCESLWPQCRRSDLTIRVGSDWAEPSTSERYQLATAKRPISRVRDRRGALAITHPARSCRYGARERLPALPPWVRHGSNVSPDDRRKTVPGSDRRSSRTGALSYDTHRGVSAHGQRERPTKAWIGNKRSPGTLSNETAWFMRSGPGSVSCPLTRDRVAACSLSVAQRSRRDRSSRERRPVECSSGA